MTSDICPIQEVGDLKQQVAERGLKSYEKVLLGLLETRTDRSGKCWIWTGPLHIQGYGKIIIYKTQLLMHRVSYEIYMGEIPDELDVLHNCPGGDNRKCVNPAHLWIGTQRDNILDCQAKGRLLTGDRHHQTKLPEHDLKELLRLRREQNLSSRQLAELFPMVGARHIRHIIRGDIRKHG